MNRSAVASRQHWSAVGWKLLCTYAHFLGVMLILAIFVPRTALRLSPCVDPRAFKLIAVFLAGFEVSSLDDLAIRSGLFDCLEEYGSHLLMPLVLLGISTTVSTEDSLQDARRGKPTHIGVDVGILGCNIVIGYVEPFLAIGRHISQVDAFVLGVLLDEPTILTVNIESTVDANLVVGGDQGGQDDACLVHAVGFPDLIKDILHALASFGNLDVPDSIIGAKVYNDNICLHRAGSATYKYGTTCPGIP